jgi:hypothetical protein
VRDFDTGDDENYMHLDNPGSEFDLTNLLGRWSVKELYEHEKAVAPYIFYREYEFSDDFGDESDDEDDAVDGVVTNDTDDEEETEMTDLSLEDAQKAVKMRDLLIMGVTDDYIRNSINEMFKNVMGTACAAHGIEL